MGQTALHEHVQATCTSLRNLHTKKITKDDERSPPLVDEKTIKQLISDQKEGETIQI